MENPNFLKKFKGLGNAPEVMTAKERTEKRTGEKIKGDFTSLIQNYLDRFTEFKKRFESFPESGDKARAMEKFKYIILDKFITKYENIPESYWAEKDEDGNMGPFFRELNDQGFSGDWRKIDEAKKDKYKKEHAETLIENQKGSIEEWLEYFMDEELSGDIPDYLKYWFLRSVIGLQEYEKPKDWDKAEMEKRRAGGEEEKKADGQFPRRSKNSLKKFPDLHPEALRYVSDAIVNKYKGQNHEFGYNIQPEEQEKFKQYLEQENFAKLYAWAMESLNPIPEELLPITAGKWVRYPQGSDLNEVVKKLKGKGTGLCIAGRGAARKYLDSGDLYIFYSDDKEGNPNFPRIAIHARYRQIAEMRGIAYKQNLDPFMTDVASAKCAEFQNGKEYEEKSEHMRRLTEIENKTMQKQDLSREELIFLYEINAPIQYFGMTKDPRIEEIRKTRNPKVDAPIVFECAPTEIAWSEEDITENTKAYIGEWNVEIFRKIRNYPNIQHLFESFPDKKIFMQNLETDPAVNSPGSAEKALERKNIYLDDWTKDVLYETQFSKESQTYELVRFSVYQLGLSKGATTDEIYKRAEDLGLDLCPAEVGVHLRLQYPGKESMFIAMKQISDHHGHPHVFVLDWYDGEKLDLFAFHAKPGGRWSSHHELVFRLRKLET